MSLEDLQRSAKPESDEAVYNRYVKAAECYSNMIRCIRRLPDDEAEEPEAVYSGLMAYGDGLSTDIINEPAKKQDGNELFYDVLYRLSLSADIGSCKKSIEMLSEYLTQNPKVMMGEIMLEVIEEQLED